MTSKFVYCSLLAAIILLLGNNSYATQSFFVKTAPTQSFFPEGINSNIVLELANQLGLSEDDMKDPEVLNLLIEILEQMRSAA